VPHYFNHGSVGQDLKQSYSSDFGWRTKNLLCDELNVLKRKLNVKMKNTINDYQLKAGMLSLNAGLLTSGRKHWSEAGPFLSLP
jgi:hypothetical protein